MDRFDHIFVITMKPLQWKPDLVHNSIVSCHTLTNFTSDFVFNTRQLN